MTMNRAPIGTVAVVLAGIIAMLASAPPAAADAGADFYRGKTITLVVGFSPGGGADTFARFFQKHFAKHMPGDPSVIVQNMPGAGGIKALNHVYNTGAQDGTRVMLTSPSHTIAFLLGRKNVRYDMNKIKWIGTLTQDTSSCVASGSSGIRSITDTKNKELIIGATGKSSSTTQHALLLKNMLGYKLRIVQGYRGTSRVRLAMKKGEVQAVCAFWASAALGPQRREVESGELVPIVQMGSKPHPALRGAPVAYSLARNDDERKIMRVVFGTTELSRPFAAPPGTPAVHLAALRKGFWGAVNSPELRKDAGRAHLIVDPLNWRDTEVRLKEILSTPKRLIERTKKIIGSK
jgi:tripartite-type tricarboxylate transporter receptor subunit TctC